jgi:diguanylate cyclase (GGDEF)-like protein
MTASFGVAACPETSRAIDNLLAQADQALYQAKQQGRDRVVVAERVR